MSSVDHTHGFAHLVLVSELPLPELGPELPADAAGGRLRIALDDGSIDWSASARPAFTDGDAAADDPDPDELAVTRRADGWGFAFRDVVRAWLDDAATTLVIAPGADARDDSVRHVVLDQLVPYAVDRRGDIALHAAAVAVDALALGVLGPSGMGKSTLATALGLAGHPVLTDDCLVLTTRPGDPEDPATPGDPATLGDLGDLGDPGDDDRRAPDDAGRPTVVVAWPTYPGLRLWPSSVAFAEQGGPVAQAPMAHYTSKVRAVPAAVPFATGPVPLGGLLVIDNPPDDDPDAVAVVALTGGAAVGALMASAFALTDGPAAKAATFERLADLADAVPVGRLLVPDDLDRLDDVVAAALAWLATPR